MASVFVFAQFYPDMNTAAAVSPEQMAAALSGAYAIAGAKVVSGIGDKAIEYSGTSSSGSAGIVIFVFKSNVVIMIALGPSTDSNAVEQLARTALSRL